MRDENLSTLSRFSQAKRKDPVLDKDHTNTYHHVAQSRLLFQFCLRNCSKLLTVIKSKCIQRWHVPWHVHVVTTVQCKNYTQVMPDDFP
jgi:hypothetical protein